MTKRGKGPRADKGVLKTLGMSLSKLATWPNQPPSGTQGGEGLKIVSRSASSLIFFFFATKLKIDLIARLSTFMDQGC